MLQHGAMEEAAKLTLALTTQGWHRQAAAVTGSMVVQAAHDRQAKLAAQAGIPPCD